MENLKGQITEVANLISLELNNSKPSVMELEKLKTRLENLNMQNQIQLDNSKKAVETYLKECDDEDMLIELNLIMGSEEISNKDKIIRLEELNHKLVLEYNEVMKEFTTQTEGVI